MNSTAQWILNRKLTADTTGLICADQFDNDTRILLYLASLVAIDPQTGAYIRTSNGRRKAGRPAKYAAWMPNDQVVKVTAYSVQEAVDKINRKQAN